MLLLFDLQEGIMWCSGKGQSPIKSCVIVKPTSTLRVCENVMIAIATIKLPMESLSKEI